MNQKPKLTLVLEAMINQAMKNQHVPVKRNLASGLQLTLTADAFGVTLILQRDQNIASDTEIKTILKYWPYFTGEVPVTQLHYNGKPALKLEIKAPQEVARSM